MAKSRVRKREYLDPVIPKKRLSQADVPFFTLTQALKIPQVIADNFALRPVRPLHVAQGLKMQLTSSGFRMLCGSSIAYGLTEGGYNAEQITVTPLGKRIIAPTKEGDDALALREALLKPRVLQEFLKHYDNAKVPREDIALNVLVDMGVPRDAVQRTLKLILESARTVGFLRDLNGALYVDLLGTPAEKPAVDLDEAAELVQAGEISPDESADIELGIGAIDLGSTLLSKSAVPERSTRVFISHGRNMEVVDQIKTMLNVAEVEYEIAVESESTAIPVPDKVLSAMRNCTAAVICVTPDSDSVTSTPVVNQNVLIEIGAAFVLYDKRVILLWDKRIPIPSNLQGLYRCEFEGSELSWSVGMKLMEAIKKFKPSSP